MHPAWCPPLAESKFNRPGPSRESVAAAPLWGGWPSWGAREDLAGGGDGRARDTRKRQRDSRGQAGRGNRRGQPTFHARHVHVACVLLCQTPGRAHPCPEGETAREEAQGHSAWDYKGKISCAVLISFATGHLPVGRLLGNTNGSISRNFLHVSSKLTLGGGGKGQGAGPALGQGRRGKGGGLSLWPPTCLPPGLLATCPPRSRACPPPSGQPGTASGLPGCS